MEKKRPSKAEVDRLGIINSGIASMNLLVKSFLMFTQKNWTWSMTKTLLNDGSMQVQYFVDGKCEFAYLIKKKRGARRSMNRVYYFTVWRGHNTSEPMRWKLSELVSYFRKEIIRIGVEQMLIFDNKL